MSQPDRTAPPLARLLEVPWLMGALAGAPLLLALVPLLTGTWPAWLIAVFLMQPIYMLHQVEEHAGDRFRAWANAHMAGGREALTPGAVAVINIGGVWILNAISLLLAGLLHPGFGLAAIWLMLVNAVAHILGAVAQRIYNPGLVTSVLLFLPAGGAALALVAAQPGVDGSWQAIGLGAALAVHAAIIAHVRLRDRAQGAGPAGMPRAA